MSDPICSQLLDNGLRADFFDQTNRYFGDFHRVSILLQIRIPANVLPSDEPGPTEYIYEKYLERMGVPSNELDATIDRLINDFMRTSGQYLGKNDFPQRFLLQKKRVGRQVNVLRDKKLI